MRRFLLFSAFLVLAELLPAQAADDDACKGHLSGPIQSAISEETLEKWFSWIERNSNLQSKGDWLNLTPEELKRWPYGNHLLFYFGHIYYVVRYRYPELPDSPWDLNEVPPVYDLSRQENRELWLKVFERRHRIKNPQGWYEFGISDLITAPEAFSFMKNYNFMFYRMISSFYPELKAWLFKKVPRGYWKNPEHIKLWISWFERIKGLQEKSDWSKISRADVVNRPGGASLLEELGENWDLFLQMAVEDRE